MKRIPENELKRINRILIIGAIGIGNLLLFSGALRLIRRHFSQAHIAIIVLRKNFKALYESDPAVDEIITLDTDEVKSFREKIAFIAKLRQNRFELCITTFPANRLEYNLLAFFSGARLRIAHKYVAKCLRSVSFLQNVRIPVNTDLHDLDQNLNLLSVLGITPHEADQKVFLSVPEQSHKNAQLFLQNKDLNNNKLIGMHPGSSVERGMILKRLPAAQFALLCDWLAETYQAVVLLFGGNDEIQLREEIAANTQNKPIIVTDLDLMSTASLIGKCSAFVTNDSGLMHVAAAMNVQTFAVFGPTDPGRTAPYGTGHVVVRTGIECSPCWSINNLGVGMVKCIHPENLCLTQLPVEMIKQALMKSL